MINFGAGLAKIAGAVKMGAALPAIAGVIVAAAVGTYYVAPQFLNSDKETASQPAQVSSLMGGDSAATDAPLAEAPAETSDTTTDGSTDAAATADSVESPSFDLLRVEQDGSTVIAGKAEPGTKLDIMSDGTVVASTSVGVSGDFAAVLDTPLAAGDHLLTLRNVSEDGAVRQSEEIATVSVPHAAGGELLAMVSKPGEASRIMAQPVAPADEISEEVAAPEPVADVAEAATDDATGEPAETATNETAAADQQAEAAPEQIVAGTASDEQSAIETPALPDAAGLLTTSAPEVAVNNEATAEIANTENPAPAEQDADVEVAMVAPDPVAEPKAAEIPSDSTVRVDAVEIEGDRIFIAGSATPGYPVRVLADGVVIGTEKADESGRFIVESTGELAVGDHIISAELLDRDEQTVLLRATVPFNRPAGEALAAVAPPEPAMAKTSDNEVATSADSTSGASSGVDMPDTLIRPDIVSISKMREASFEALTVLEQMVSASDADAAAVSTALADTVTKLKAAAMAELPADSSDEASAMAESMRAQANAALSVLMPLADGERDLLADPAKTSEMLKQAGSGLSEPSRSDIAAANAPDPATDANGQSGEPRTIVQAPLASTPGAVIIRRGDTLWQISRRTYGQGVRYTTIYVANKSQIQDPDRIKPGQVFSVPDSPLENAEELHKQLLDGGNKS
ncbi:LysM domain-containing protein [Hoeflea sp. IMCC20628]|uniref:Ig-like domain-containing protein n=1 Tax=Hoeflea sp. IMCC20628 TaxID=1620421 RepID=UPI00063BD8A8|nr:Ig-like domain-containing protein [Hoeflea sp. IMCC20628]AKH99912.1 LysM domain-containing protein [Hoeflea sp. IMCC20628]